MTHFPTYRLCYTAFKMWPVLSTNPKTVKAFVVFWLLQTHIDHNHPFENVLSVLQPKHKQDFFCWKLKNESNNFIDFNLKAKICDTFIKLNLLTQTESYIFTP